MNHRLVKSMPKSVVVVGLLLLVGLLAWYFWRSPQPRFRKHGGNRSNVIRTACVREMELLLNGKPLFDQIHHVRLGGDFNITGRLMPRKECLPNVIPDMALYIVHHPAGTDEMIWSKRAFLHELRYFPVQHLQHVLQPNPLKADLKQFSLGSHDIRAYLSIRDFEGENDTFDLIGRAKLVVDP